MPSRVHLHHGCRAGICLLCTIECSLSHMPRMTNRQTCLHWDGSRLGLGCSSHSVHYNSIICVQHVPKPFQTWKRLCFLWEHSSTFCLLFGSPWQRTFPLDVVWVECRTFVRSWSRTVEIWKAVVYTKSLWSPVDSTYSVVFYSLWTESWSEGENAYRVHS